MRFKIIRRVGQLDSFCPTTNLCGPILDKYGMRLDPGNKKSLQDMRSPQTPNKLQQYFCTTNWMRTAISDYERNINILQDFLKVCFRRTGAFMKLGITGILLIGLWGPRA